MVGEGRLCRIEKSSGATQGDKQTMLAILRLSSRKQGAGKSIARTGSDDTRGMPKTKTTGAEIQRQHRRRLTRGTPTKNARRVVLLVLIVHQARHLL